MGGCEIKFRFPVAKLLDWQNKLDQLLESKNVFALIVAAQLHAKLLKEPKQKLDAKTQLVRLLYERGYSREQVIELFKFIDWMIRLPDNLEIQFKNIIDQIEEERNMAYVTSVERIAAQEGKLEQAIQMIRDFNLSVKEVAEKYQLPLQELKERLNQEKH